jgi:hypothetical protein
LERELAQCGLLVGECLCKGRYIHHVEQEVFCDGPALALVVCVGGRWAVRLVVFLGYTGVCRGCPTSTSGFSISSSWKVVVGMAVGAAMNGVVGDEFGSAFVE